MAGATSTDAGAAIGIDLGTTFSCVAVVRNGKVEVIANEQGNFTTPSIVAFNEHERMIGDAAKEQIIMNPTNTVFDAKRLIGQRFDHPLVQNDMQQWSFKVFDVNGMPKVKVRFQRKMKSFAAEEISAMVLGKMKDIAEDYLNAKVTNAVVTVPAHFNDLQRKATKDAGTIAGLNILRIIDEPTAAAIAYGLDNSTETAKNVLVYDLGGGTFDVSILNICNNIFEVRAQRGDTHLGGEDFDGILMNFFAEQFKRKHKNNICNRRQPMQKLRTACERSKRILSSAMNATVVVDSIYKGKDFKLDISRDRFNDLCADKFNETIKIVELTLIDANMKPENIDAVVLVGGSTRIVKIQQLLRDFFNGKELCKTINPEQAVAVGAAIKAAIIHGEPSETMKNMKLLEITPMTLGVATDRGSKNMHPVIKRNTRIPVCKIEEFETAKDYQTTFDIRIIQGEHQLAKNNFKIGDLIIEGIPIAPAGEEKLYVKFSIDENGILTVSAASESRRTARGAITIKNVNGSLTKDEIVQMTANEISYRKQDRERKQLVTARYELEQYVIKIRDTGGSENGMIHDMCKAIFSRLDRCENPTLYQFSQWKNELEQLIQSTNKNYLEVILPSGFNLHEANDN